VPQRGLPPVNQASVLLTASEVDVIGKRSGRWKKGTFASSTAGRRSEGIGCDSTVKEGHVVQPFLVLNNVPNA
jgi:hypothetical protein